VRELFRFHYWQMTECDRQIQAELASLSNRAGEKNKAAIQRRCGRKCNNLRLGTKDLLFRALGVDLTLIEGIEEEMALMILAEVGADVSRFPIEKHFTSWLRVCPPQNESNNTRKRRFRHKASSRATITLRLAARVVGRTNTPLGLFYRRIRSRVSGLGAVKATARKLACLVYGFLTIMTTQAFQLIVLHIHVNSSMWIVTRCATEALFGYSITTAEQEDSTLNASEFRVTWLNRPISRMTLHTGIQLHL
jgi:hypothetical protein